MLQVKSAFALPLQNVPRSSKVIIVTAGVGIIILGILARYFGQRKKPTSKTGERYTRRNFSYQYKGLNGELPQIKQNGSPGLCRCQQRCGSTVSIDRPPSVMTLTTAGIPHDYSPKLSPQQYGVMGMEALETAIAYWEDSIKAFSPDIDVQAALTTAREAEFVNQLNGIILKAQYLKEDCNTLFLNESSVLFKAEIQSVSDYGIKQFGAKSVDTESFVSAEGTADIADIRDFEQPSINIETLQLYQTALRHLEKDGIPCRILRAEYMHCTSDNDYLIKLHCIRLSFQYLVEQEDIRRWFINAGGQVLAALLIFSEKDPKDSLIAYESLVDYVQVPAHWPTMDEELKGRGIRCISLYDILLDFILLDAFEDLANPPQSVMAVIQNRWLSSGFKETAFSTAVWSVIKAKKSLLKVQDGFFAHFYTLLEHLTPVLAWGFLGTNEDLKEVCVYFKEEVVGLLQDMYDLHSTRYTTLEDLSEDIFNNAQVRYDKICQRLSII